MAVNSSRLLLRSSRTFLNSKWYYSSNEQSKISSNQDFQTFTTKEDVKNFITRPRFSFENNIILFWHPNPGISSKFLVDNQDLLNGSKIAIESVTQILSSGKELTALKDLLTADCYSSIVNQFMFSKLTAKPHLHIPQEDIFLAWLQEKKIQKGIKKMKVVTLSYPKYSWLKNKVKEDDDLKESMAAEVKAGNADLPNDLKISHLGYCEYYKFNPIPYFNKNEIIVSNWDLVQDLDDDWKIDGITICNLKRITDFFTYTKWKGRLKLAICTRTSFLAAIRYAYINERLVLLICVFILAISPILGAR